MAGGDSQVSPGERLELRFLGEMQVRSKGRGLALPPSRKTRALLAYLALNPRPHRRDRLCDLLWDVADDPRGALRWSLSKLRPLVDVGRPRIRADREHVTLDVDDVDIDVLALRSARLEGVAELAARDHRFRGEFLEGLDLPDFQAFHGWCVTVREQSRLDWAGVLRTLADRPQATPEETLSILRDLVSVDPDDVTCRARLIRALVGCGRRAEAEAQFEAAGRLLGNEATEALQAALNRPSLAPSVPGPAVDLSWPVVPSPVAAELAGRGPERARLLALLEKVRNRQQVSMLLVSGEPGLGKTRLLADLAARVQSMGGTVLEGTAYEAERNRPYGPWVDALRRRPAAAGDAAGVRPALLIPDLSGAAAADSSQERLFGAVADFVAARALSAPPVLVLLDDVQWCDESSVAMLHYVTRMNRHRPLLVALAARAGELPDNHAVLRLLRSMRRDGPVEELRLGPLSPPEVAELLAGLEPPANADRIYQLSGGNPLFALEIARNPGDGDVPSTLSEVIRDRIDRIPADAVEVLRWSSVLGQTFTVDRLALVVSLPLQGLTDALEMLERHALLHPLEGLYAFTHEVVHRSVYEELSGPRRRLMHRRIAQVLEADVGLDHGVDLAHHAELGGDDGLTARACLAAGRHCLRIFAGSEAELLTRRGITAAARLPGPERVQLQLELMRVAIHARRPREVAETASHLEALAGEALDHGLVEVARLGFQLLSELYWEGGDWSDAARQSRRAEQVSRGIPPAERVVAMAESARCLAMLERDLGQADALAREARALAGRLQVSSAAIPDAAGLLLLAAGKLDEATEQFEEARTVARTQGDRLYEFFALEHRIIVEIERSAWTSAEPLVGELVGLGARLRDGSEAPYANVLAALCRYAMDATGDRSALDEALQSLHQADAKQRLAYALNRTARVALSWKRHGEATQLAEEGLSLAQAVERPTEVVVSMTVLMQAAPTAAVGRQWCEALGRASVPGLSPRVRREAEHAVAQYIAQRG